ncbi:hypothetical protein CPAV1605_625 [seawater metagenome]|uniref:Uncharacterized protein n=1 Tax=seawater metagenome TaxID=1561972 RepID=A0A5E8CM80_9ZZZZ
MANTNYDDLKPLFSGAHQGKYNDDRAKLFAHYLEKINGPNVTNGFNNADANVTPANFNEFMEVKNYEDNTKPAGSRDNDIHPEIQAFVNDMALYHAAFDASQAGAAGVAQQRTLVNAIRNCAPQSGNGLTVSLNAIMAIITAANAGGNAIRAAIAANGGRLNATAFAGGAPLNGQQAPLQTYVIREMEQTCAGLAANAIPQARANITTAEVNNALVASIQWPVGLAPANGAVWALGQPGVPTLANVEAAFNAQAKRIMENALQVRNVGGNNIQGNQAQKDMHTFLQKWDSLEPFVKGFYNALLNIVNVQTGASLPISSIKGLGNLDQHRINFKTIDMGGNQVNVVNNMLPQIGTWAGAVWTSPVVSVPAPAPVNHFKALYTATYGAGGVYNAPQQRTMFSYNLSKYFRSLLADKAGSIQSTPGSGVSKILMADDDNQDIYGRQNGKLVKDVNGQYVEVGRGTSYYNQQASLNNQCMTTQVKPSGGRTCTDYINNCLLGRDIADCQTYFANADFWDVTEQEIQNMLPTMAIDTLSKFGYTQSAVYDETAQRDIVKVQSVQSWMEGLDNVTNDQATKTSIRGNIKLRAYLEGLVTLVNRNPAILNSNYSGPTNESIPYNPNKFSYTQLGKFGLKARYPVGATSQRDIEFVASAINRENIRLGLRIGVPMFGAVMPVTLMGGGNAMQIETAVSQLADSDKYTSQIFENMFKYYVGKLKSNQKDISKKDTDAIQNLINDLHKKEKKLYEVMNFVEKYSILVSLFGENASQQVVEWDDIKRAVNARKSIFAKKVKRENDLVSVIRAVVNATVNETNQGQGPSGPSAPVGQGANL